MGNRYTTTELVNNILLVGHAPGGNKTFTPEIIINLADRELQTAICSQILSSRGGYYLSYQDYAPSLGGLYPIPSDSVGGALENIELVDNTAITSISMIEESEQGAGGYTFFMKGNFVQILPNPTQGVLRMWYSRRPSQLVSTSLAAQITAIDGTGLILSVSSLPSQITVNTSVDSIRDQPMFELLSTNVIQGISGTDITLNAPIIGLSVGDWIALHNQTPVPQIPVEYRPLLEQRVVVKMYELQGFDSKMKMAQAKLLELEKSVFKLISSRVKSKTRVISSTVGGFLSGSGRRFRNFPVGP